MPFPTIESSIRRRGLRPVSQLACLYVASGLRFGLELELALVDSDGDAFVLKTKSWRMCMLESSYDDEARGCSPQA